MIQVVNPGFLIVFIKLQRIEYSVNRKNDSWLNKQLKRVAE